MTEAVEVRHDWTRSEIEALLDLPLMDLLWRAQGVHRASNPGYHVQLASLLSVKTGGCEEDCAYCPQSMHHSSDVTGQPELQVAPVLERAKAAKQAGADRFCMGWAWREIRDGAPFEAMLQMVSGVRALGMEACVTAGMTLCCGGIIGMGETVKDRASMLQVLASINPHPESVPINALVAVEGTPLEELPPIDPIELVRMIAVTRILMPGSRVRLSAGREQLSKEAQILCLQAGADSIFYGETLLTTGNPAVEADRELLRTAGVQANWHTSAEKLAC